MYARVDVVIDSLSYEQSQRVHDSIRMGQIIAHLSDALDQPVSVSEL